jgi:hypothetical protein
VWLLRCEGQRDTYKRIERLERLEGARRRSAASEARHADAADPLARAIRPNDAGALDFVRDAVVGSPST